MNIETALRRMWTTLRRLLRSQAEVMRRATGRSEAHKRRAMEAERLDRIRNPHDYEGK